MQGTMYIPTRHTEGSTIHVIVTPSHIVWKWKWMAKNWDGSNTTSQGSSPMLKQETNKKSIIGLQR